MERSSPFRLQVSGANACFTRPEMKVERVSYDVMTPSAARVFWKPFSGNRPLPGKSSRSMC